MFMDKDIVSRRFSLESRRYIGCKTKLVDWIFDLIDQHAHDVHSFCDIFSGTGVVAQRALNRYEHVVVNDFLYSNNIMYRAFFGAEEWDEEKVQGIIDEFNSIKPNRIGENYFSKNFGGKYFHHDTAKIIGYIRGRLQRMKNNLTDKEYAVLLASLIYSVDRHANTMGHFDAYHKKAPTAHQFQMRMIEAESFKGVEIFREDANLLARSINVDLTYIDPPYNSRQYSRFYHVYENLDYCRTAALSAFTDLVSHVDTRYLVVSYNNTYKSKSSSSENKIKLEQLEGVLKKCGKTMVFNQEFKPFNSGKTEFDDHREYLFITEVDNEKRNSSFPNVLRG